MARGEGGRGGEERDVFYGEPSANSTVIYPSICIRDGIPRLGFLNWVGLLGIFLPHMQLSK